MTLLKSYCGFQPIWLLMSYMKQCVLGVMFQMSIVNSSIKWPSDFFLPNLSHGVIKNLKNKCSNDPVWHQKSKI